MALKKLIENQVVRIDDHKRGSREIKNWDDERNDIHIDKTTNRPINGKIQEVRIRIPINSARPIRIENSKGQDINDIPRGLKREIVNALENENTRGAFVNDVMRVLEDFETALSSEERARQVLTNISKHFDLNWPDEIITNYAKDITQSKDVLRSYTLVYHDDEGKEFFSRLDEDKIEVGQYNGYAKMTRKLNI
ncbi:hypothetical protein LJC45_04905 [Alistipes sp. OttesenSCG-928-B03]|nr:hypothetical protein [Alistipes sp. OttesenSCG-928-B03]